VRPGRGEHAVPVGLAPAPQVAEQVHHRHRAQQRGRVRGVAAQQAHLLLELAGRGGVERVVPRVVGPRCEFVEQHLTARGHEQLDAEHADVVQRGDGLGGQGLRAVRHVIVDRRRQVGGRQDAVLVPVLARRVAGHRGVRGAADDHRQLARERHPLLKDALDRPHRGPGGGRRGRRVDARLALAVVTAGGALEQGRGADRRDRGVQRVGIAGGLGHGRPGHSWQAVSGEKRLLVQAILGRGDGGGAGAHDARPR